MNNEVLEYLKRLIENKYGSLDNERGCYADGQWLSIKNIVKLIDRADENYYKGITK